jgi:hypothetical protein
MRLAIFAFILIASALAGSSRCRSRPGDRRAAGQRPRGHAVIHVVWARRNPWRPCGRRCWACAVGAAAFALTLAPAPANLGHAARAPAEEPRPKRSCSAGARWSASCCFRAGRACTGISACRWCSTPNTPRAPSNRVRLVPWCPRGDPRPQGRIRRQRVRVAADAVPERAGDGAALLVKLRVVG